MIWVFPVVVMKCCVCLCDCDDKNCRKAGLFCSVDIHTTQRFSSSVLCWSECDFCFSRKVTWGVGAGRVILFIVLTGQRVWLQAGLAEGTAACWELVWAAMAIQPSSLGFLGAAQTERAARAAGGRAEPVHGFLSPPRLCFPHFQQAVLSLFTSSLL